MIFIQLFLAFFTGFCVSSYIWKSHYPSYYSRKQLELVTSKESLK